jgi:hypothetical protein
MLNTAGCFVTNNVTRTEVMLMLLESAKPLVRTTDKLETDVVIYKPVHPATGSGKREYMQPKMERQQLWVSLKMASYILRTDSIPCPRTTHLILHITKFRGECQFIFVII